MNKSDTKKTSGWENIIRGVFAKSKEDKEYFDKKINPDWIIGLIKSKIIPEQLDIFKRRNNSTVIERLQVMMKKLDIKSITPEEKTDIGRLVSETFFKQTSSLYVRHETMLEPEGKVIVNVYPSRFVPVIDSLIKQYYEDYGLYLKLSKIKIDDLNLSVRALTSLKVMKLENLADVVESSERILWQQRNCGPKTRDEITQMLTDRGLSFEMNLKKNADTK